MYISAELKSRVSVPALPTIDIVPLLELNVRLSIVDVAVGMVPVPGTHETQRNW